MRLSALRPIPFEETFELEARIIRSHESFADEETIDIRRAHSRDVLTTKYAAFGDDEALARNVLE